jgi:hypothetical protein
MKIQTISDFRRAMRAGPWAWPGGYPVYFVTADGAALSFKAARDNRRKILGAIAEDNRGGGWRIVAADLALEGPLYCDATGEKIETAYGDVEDEAAE